MPFTKRTWKWHNPRADLEQVAEEAFVDGSAGIDVSRSRVRTSRRTNCPDISSCSHFGPALSFSMRCMNSSNM